jgi:hypothetical protein
MTPSEEARALLDAMDTQHMGRIVAVIRAALDQAEADKEMALRSVEQAWTRVWEGTCERDTALAEVERLTRTLEERNDTLDSQANAIEELLIEVGRQRRVGSASISSGLIGKLEDENARLTRWKAEAAVVLARWGAVYDALDRPGRLGDSMAVSALAEVKRLRELVGDESVGAGQWDGCSRADAIRQASDFHERANRWLEEHDKRRDERDEARAQVASVVELRDEADRLGHHRVNVDLLSRALNNGGATDE